MIHACSSVSNEEKFCRGLLNTEKGTKILERFDARWEPSLQEYNIILKETSLLYKLFGHPIVLYLFLFALIMLNIWLIINFIARAKWFGVTFVVCMYTIGGIVAYSVFPYVRFAK